MWAVIVVVVVAVIIIITIITTTIIIIYKVTVLLNRKRFSVRWNFASARRFKSPWQFCAELKRRSAVKISGPRVESSRGGRTDGRTGRCLQIYAGERLRNIALRVPGALHGRKPCD